MCGCGGTSGLRQRSPAARRSGAPTAAARRHLLVFLACAAGVAPAVGGAVGAAVVVTISDAVWLETWVRWTVGDALGVLVMAPPLLSWHARPPTSRSLAERAGVAAAVLAGAALALLDGGPTWRALLPYLTLPALVWAATRFGMRGATLAGLVTAHAANLPWPSDRDPSPPPPTRTRRRRCSCPSASRSAPGSCWPRSPPT
jgi:hypothetical protein